MEQVFQMILHIYFLQLRFLQLKLKYILIFCGWYAPLSTSFFMFSEDVFFVFLQNDHPHLLILFVSNCGISSHSYILNIFYFTAFWHSLKHTFAHIMKLMHLFLLLAEWFSGPRQTWVQILA